MIEINDSERNRVALVPFKCPACGNALSWESRECPACLVATWPLLRVAMLPDHHFNSALAFARERQWGRASECLGAALALRPGDAEAYFLLAKVRKRAGDGEGALAACRAALAIDPLRSDFQAALARLSGGGQAASAAKSATTRHSGKGSAKRRF